MALTFSNNQLATVQNSWLDPRKVREMTIVGTRRMIVYDDVEPLEKIKIYDARVDRPPHYNTFAEFTYSYHYGDIYVPYVKQEEPLKVECQHFLDCINTGASPISNGQRGLELVRILEASSKSLKANGAPVYLNDEAKENTRPVIQIRPAGRARANVNGHANGNGHRSRGVRVL
jgi:predicted dehydrogenase